MASGDRVMIKPIQRRWAVYDRERGSIPLAVPGFGIVQPDGGFTDRDEAEAVAIRYGEFIEANSRAFPS